MVLVKTSPESFHAPPAFSRSSLRYSLTRERSNRKFWQCHRATAAFALGPPTNVNFLLIR